ncbi:MAG TPA: glycosyltransferase [Candidatus Babeliales bacterium]|jgi:colanic acid/amylovoran biosynthesis glycosyltransferase|nr:glycosyltransferase [Candidatus Babeliales bacterium]
MKIVPIFLSLLLANGLIFCDEHKKPMKILMVVACFPKIHDICMLNQMTGLIDRGHDVDIYAFYKGDCARLQEDVITYDLINKTFFQQLPDCLDEYDIIVFQLGHKLFDVRKTHNYKGKIAVCLRGFDITGYLRQHAHAYDKYFDTCDLFMPVCEAFKKLLEQEGCPLHKIVVHHSSIDCDKFIFKHRKLPQEGSINIISAGRFIEKKGFVYAIRAIAQLIKKYPRIRYTIIGDGILKKKYQKLIKKLNVGNNIKIQGWHTHQEYIKILDKAHLFILPSVTAENNDQEGIPNVLKEAMAMGLIVVATDHSGNSELIQDKHSGFLVRERSISAISNAVEHVLNNPDTWSSIQLQAVQKVHEEFDKEMENDKLETIFYNLLRQ